MSTQSFYLRPVLVLLTGIILASCSWVDVSPGGESVRIISPEEAMACRKIGNASVSVLDNVVGIPRSRDKMVGELQTLARNNAVEMGGNAVAAAGEPKDGKQVFHVYRCP